MAQTTVPYPWDFEKLHMKFLVARQHQQLQGISPSNLHLVEGDQFGRLTRNNHRGLMVHLLENVQLLTITPSTESIILQLVEEYSHIFEDPNGLPPPRSQDHHID